MTDQSPARYDEVGPDIPLDQARLLALVVMIVVATQVWVAIDAWQLLRAIAGVPGDDPYPNDGMLLDTRLRVHLFDDRTRMNVIPAVALLVALLCLIAWMYAARRLAESYAAQGFRRGRAWTFWGWWLPIISFWFPYQSMADVWTGSDPNPPPGHPGPGDQTRTLGDRVVAVVGRVRALPVGGRRRVQRRLRTGQPRAAGPDPLDRGRFPLRRHRRAARTGGPGHYRLRARAGDEQGDPGRLNPPPSEEVRQT